MTAGKYLSARIAARENAVSLAADAFRDVAVKHGDNPQLVRHAFFYSLAAGDIEAALERGRLLISINGAEADAAGVVSVDGSPENADGLARLLGAADAIKRRDYVAAQEQLAFSSNEPFVAAMAHLLKAWTAVGIGGPAAGLASLETGVEDIFTGFHPAHVAFIAEMAGKRSLAAEAHRNSVFGLGGPVGRAAYGAFLERGGDREAAEGYYTLIARQPGPDRRMAREGLARLARGEKTDAYASVAPNEGAAIAFYSFAAFLLEQFAEQREKADAAGFDVGQPRYNLPLGLVQIALHLDSDFAEARRLAGVVFNIYEDAPSAIAALDGIAPSSPHYVQAQIEIAGALARQGRADEAMARLSRVVRRTPDSTEARFALANIAASEEDHQEAIRQLTKIIDALGDNPQTDAWRYYVARGDALLKVDRWSDAEADLKVAVDIAPEEPTALNYLGYVWAERGVNLDAAFALIEKAVEGDETSGAIIDSLGWAYYQTGAYEESVEHLETAAALEPADPTITEHLGDVYWRLGRRIEARYQWERALELDPTDKQETAISEKLANGMTPAPAAVAAEEDAARRGATRPTFVSTPVREPGDGPAPAASPDRASDTPKTDRLDDPR